MTKNKKSIVDLNQTRMSRISKKTNQSTTPRKRTTYNYNSFLDKNEFVPKHKELKSLIDNTTEHIGKTVYELANKTKETSEKLKKILGGTQI